MYSVECSLSNVQRDERKHIHPKILLIRSTTWQVLQVTTDEALPGGVFLVSVPTPVLISKIGLIHTTRQTATDNSVLDRVSKLGATILLLCVQNKDTRERPTKDYMPLTQKCCLFAQSGSSR